MVVQVYRYVRVYDAVQRQQTKWFVFGLSIVISLLSIEGILSAVVPSSPWYQLFNGPMWLLIWTVVLLSVSIPIFRYRLWDIDVIINRTLVYGSLTVLLVIAALFQPLRRGLQALIDRRFYRGKYNAAKITAAFSATLRDEVELDQLSEQLMAVVQETMQPFHVSLWVRQSSRTGTPSLQINQTLPDEERNVVLHLKNSGKISR